MLVDTNINNDDDDDDSIYLYAIKNCSSDRVKTKNSIKISKTIIFIYSQGKFPNTNDGQEL